MGQKKITDLQLISAVTGALNLIGDTTLQTYRLTVTQLQEFTTKLTTRGDIMYRGASDNARLAKGTAGDYLSIGANDPEWRTFVAPTLQRLTSTGSTVGYLFTITSGSATDGATYTNNGNTYTVISTVASGTRIMMTQASAPSASGTLTKATGTGDATLTFSAAQAIATYTTPTSPRSPVFLRIKQIGGGGGGGGSGGPTNGVGGTGKETVFGNLLLITGGGVGGDGAAGGGGGGGGLGGVPIVNAGPITIVSMNGNGGQGPFQASSIAGNTGDGKLGGAGPFGGVTKSTHAGAGGAGVANSGSGGGGGGLPSNVASATDGAGGGAGAYIEAIIASPAATYYYCVGTGGAAGAAGSSGSAGAAGGSGVIIVEEHYQ